MKYMVCPDCKGYGSHKPGFAYDGEMIDQMFESLEDFNEHMEDIRNGVYDTRCDYCKGQRVVTEERYYDWEDEQAFRDAVAAEQRAFGIL